MVIKTGRLSISVPLLSLTAYSRVPHLGIYRNVWPNDAGDTLQIQESYQIMELPEQTHLVKKKETGWSVETFIVVLIVPTI